MVKARSPGAKGKAKWGERNERRQKKRVEEGKKPLVRPLTMAPVGERAKALKDDHLVFYDGKKKIRLPLILERFGERRPLQGVFRGGDQVFVIRRKKTGDEFSDLVVNRLEDTQNGLHERATSWFFSTDEELNHMSIEESERGQGLALVAVSKADKHIRSKQGGTHIFNFYNPRGKYNNMLGVFMKLGYTPMGPVPNQRLLKEGKHQAKDNLDEFHRIEAVDPKTGKTKTFTFAMRE